MEESDLWIVSEKEVSRLGIPIKLKGYYYLVLAVALSVKVGLRKEQLSKGLYLKIAEMNDVTSYSVEKDIRNCLIKAWSDDNSLLRKTYPEYSKKPTNSEVIAFITRRIRLETPLRI